MNAETRVDLAALRQSNPLPEIAASILPLTRHGNEWKGCCPFHSDRTPSFTIFAGGQRFHCFGCVASGELASALVV